MKENKMVRKQLIKNMIIYFVGFSIIFSVFGLFIYGQVSNSLYKSADEELLNGKNRMGIIQKFSKTNELQENDIQPIKVPIQDIPREKEEKKSQQGVNPRLIYLIRNEDGSISDDSNINDEEYYDDIKFDSSNLDKVYNTNILDEYSYRGINYKIEQDGKVIYIQVLINIDAEEAMIENFIKTLVISIFIITILSVIVSYILSKKTLKPIIDSWRRQTEFVQNASHELRTPLTIIQAKQELMLEEPNSKIIDKAEELTISLSETRRLSKLVKDLMALARADSDNIQIKKEKINIDYNIKNMSYAYADLAKAQRKNFVLDLKYNKEISVDKDKINQLLVILLDNAIKYTQKDESIEIHTYEKENKFILEVRDTGIGISDDAIKHIFERFYREDKARTRQTGGSGLGLSIAKFIVEIHGGIIKAEHNKEKGTAIIVKLPK